jgi:Rieske 2Fe-2S family protein
MTPYLKPHDLRNTKIAYEMDLIEPGNWKITMENNRECYHCAVNHPELTIPLFAYGFGFAPEELDDVGRQEVKRYDCLLDDNHAEWEAKGFPSRTLEHLDDMVTGYRTQRLPLDGAGESHTLSTEVACRRLLGGITERKLGGLHFWTQPNSWHHFMSDHVVTFAVIPLDAETSLLRTKWLVHKDAVEGVDYDVKKLTEVWIATNAQDSELVGFQHSGVASPAYEPGPYSPHTEGLVDKFCNWYIGRVGEHLER